jgi:hypothetical protein
MTTTTGVTTIEVIVVTIVTMTDATIDVARTTTIARTITRRSGR